MTVKRERANTTYSKLYNYLNRNHPYFWHVKTNEVSWYPPPGCRLCTCLVYVIIVILLAVYRGEDLPPPLPTVWDDDPADQVDVCVNINSDNGVSLNYICSNDYTLLHTRKF